MSYPILYGATETNFDHNGIGILSACVSCEITEEANGIFEMAMQYPMDGIHFEDIADRSIIKAKADQFRDPQLFRVYAISKPMNGIVSVLAEHISYDLSGIPVSPFFAESVPSAFAGLKSNAVVDCPFEFVTDKTTSGRFTVPTPASIRSRLGGVEGSILDVYGGEYEFDNYTVKLHNNRGMNRGVSIRYGKNLTDILQEQNCSNVATGVYPYWTDSEGTTIVELPERIVNVPGTHDFVKIRTIDFSSEFEAQPTVEQLRARTEKYINSNNVGVPSVSLTVSFAQLEQTEEYKHMKLLERVSLFDTVNVEFPALGVSATAMAVKVIYDVLYDRVKSVTLGSVRANIADTIADQNANIDTLGKDILAKPSRTELEKAKEAATAWLTNGKGYKVERRDENGNTIDTLYMDTQDINTAVNILRIGQSGIGFSKNGVNGPYESAWTIDGKFNADFIAGLELFGVTVKAGIITSEDGKIVIDLTSESSSMMPKFNTGISTNGLHIRADEAGSSTLLSIKANKLSSSDDYFADMNLYSANGVLLERITELFDDNLVPTGSILELFDTGGLSSVQLRCSSDSPLIMLTQAGNGYPIAGVYPNGESFVNANLVMADSINGMKPKWEYITSLGRYVLCSEYV